MLNSRTGLLRGGSLLILCLLVLLGTLRAQTPIPTNDPPYYGPFAGHFLADGDGIKKPLSKDDSVLRADSPWTMYCWVWTDELPKGLSLIAGTGRPEDEYSRFLALDNGKLTVWMGKDDGLSSSAALMTGKWQFITATFNGSEIQIYSDGTRVGEGKLELGSVNPVLQMAPAGSPVDSQHSAAKS